MPQHIDFLPPHISESLDSARTLADDVVAVALKMVAEHARSYAKSGNCVADSCMDGAAIIWGCQADRAGQPAMAA